MIVKAETNTTVTGVTITMSPEEAAVLRQIAYVIGGSLNGPRGVIYRLDVELEKAGIKRTGVGLWGNAYFRDVN